MKTIYIFCLTLGMMVASCTDRDDDLSTINIRIRNVSGMTFDEVQVGEQETLHMDIAPDAYSDYLPYETAYRYAYISIRSGEETYVLQPVDFVGETVLPIGLYTYELDVTEEGEVLLHFEAD